MGGCWRRKARGLCVTSLTLQLLLQNCCTWTWYFPWHDIWRLSLLSLPFLTTFTWMYGQGEISKSRGTLCHSLKSISLFTLGVVSKGWLGRIMTYCISYFCASCFPELKYPYDSNVQSSFKTLQEIWIGNNIYVGSFRKVVAWQRGKSRVCFSSTFLWSSSRDIHRNMKLFLHESRWFIPWIQTLYF